MRLTIIGGPIASGDTTILICEYSSEDNLLQQKFEVQSKSPNIHSVFSIDKNDVRTLAYVYFANSEPMIRVPLRLGGVFCLANCDLTKDLISANAKIHFPYGIDFLFNENLENEFLTERMMTGKTLLILSPNYFEKMMQPHFDVTIPTAKDFLKLFFEQCRIGAQKEKEAAAAVAEAAELERTALQAELLSEEEDKKSPKKPVGKKSAGKKELPKKNSVFAVQQRQIDTACKKLAEFASQIAGFSPTTHAATIKKVLVDANQVFEAARSKITDVELIQQLCSAKQAFDNVYRDFLSKVFLMHKETNAQEETSARKVITEEQTKLFSLLRERYQFAPSFFALRHTEECARVALEKEADEAVDKLPENFLDYNTDRLRDLLGNSPEEWYEEGPKP